jgi:hypothetical protein
MEHIARSNASQCEICGTRTRFFSKHPGFSMSESFHQCSVLIFNTMPLLSGEAAQLGNLSDIWKHWTKKQILSYCLFSTSLRHPHTVHFSTTLPPSCLYVDSWAMPGNLQSSIFLLSCSHPVIIGVSLSLSLSLNISNTLWV